MMADSRVHPAAVDEPPSSTTAATSPKHSDENLTPPEPQLSKPVPPPATYVVQFPREQILRYPPPENARKFQNLTRRKNRRSCCRRCCCYTLCLLLLLLIIAAAVSSGVLYFVFRFKSPKYTVTNLAINGMDLNSASPISPRFNVTIRAENPNGKVGIYYLKDGAVRVFYNDVKLSDGFLPAFYQPKNNVTEMQAAVMGSDVVLGRNVRAQLRSVQSQRRVPFMVRVTAPVKIKVGSAKTWEITVKVKCDVVVDELNQGARIISNDCDYRVRLW